jgi:hypothetical protein
MPPYKRDYVGDAPYLDAAKSGIELEYIKGTIDRQDEAHLGALYIQMRTLWNEIHRLRTSQYQAGDMQRLLEANFKLQDQHTALQVKLIDAQNALITMTEQRNEARAELHDAQGLMIAANRQRDEARAQVINLETANATQSNEIMRLRGLPYNEQLQEGESKAWRRLHDCYVLSVLPECLRIAAQRQDAARSIGRTAFEGDEQFRLSIVNEARLIADAAMKARNQS